MNNFNFVFTVSCSWADLGENLLQRFLPPPVQLQPLCAHPFCLLAGRAAACALFAAKIAVFCSAQKLRAALWGEMGRAVFVWTHHRIIGFINYIKMFPKCFPEALWSVASPPPPPSPELSDWTVCLAFYKKNTECLAADRIVFLRVCQGLSAAILSG
jgi:hypothetical protein